MFNIGMPEFLVIAVVALLVVGPKKLPEIARSLGKGLAEFRKVTEEATDTLKETLKETEARADQDGGQGAPPAGKAHEPNAPAGSGTADIPPPEAPKIHDPGPQP